jgi:uncharacterized membrane protein YgcG
MADRASRRIATMLMLCAVAAGALPAAASADAAGAALGAPIVRASAHAVPTGTGSANYVIECTAISVSPAAATRVACSGGGASGAITLPGQVAEVAAVGSGPFGGAFTLCVGGTTYLLGGGTSSNGGCASSAGLTAVVV